MSHLLKIAGGIGIGYLLLGRAAGALFNRIEYNFAGFRRGDFRIRIREGMLVGMLRIRYRIKQSSGLNLFAEGLRLALYQQDQYLGQVRLDERVSLPNGEEVEIPFDLVIPASDLLNRLEKLFTDTSSSWYAPIQIEGRLVLSDGRILPIKSSLNFVSLG